MAERRIKEARFPAAKSLDCFDFAAAAVPSLNKTLVLARAWPRGLMPTVNDGRAALMPVTTLYRRPAGRLGFATSMASTGGLTPRGTGLDGFNQLQHP